MNSVSFSPVLLVLQDRNFQLLWAADGSMRFPAHGTHCVGIPHLRTHRLGLSSRADFGFPQRTPPSIVFGSGNAGRPVGPLAHPCRHPLLLPARCFVPFDSPVDGSHSTLARFSRHPHAGNGQGVGRPYSAGRPCSTWRDRNALSRPCPWKPLPTTAARFWDH